MYIIIELAGYAYPWLFRIKEQILFSCTLLMRMLFVAIPFLSIYQQINLIMFIIVHLY